MAAIFFFFGSDAANDFAHAPHLLDELLPAGSICLVLVIIETDEIRYIIARVSFHELFFIFKSGSIVYEQQMV